MSGSLAAAGGTIRTPGAAPVVVPESASPGTGAAGPVEIEPALYRRLASGGRRDFAIEFRERADLSAAAHLDWRERGRYVYEHLRQTAEQSQSAVRRMLRTRGIAFEAHWIKNTILVHQGDMAALRAAGTFAEVRRIRELPDAKPIKAERTARAPTVAAVDGVEENIHWIGADQVWAQGTTGSGVTVGVIDTGVRYTHEALRRQYRGYHDGSYDHDYNWFAPGLETPEPISSDPHGSHVTGTIAGDDHATDPAERHRIGVAPGAQWIACLGFPLDIDPNFALLSCGEFMLAPTRTDGSDANPDLRPEVVNNSWSEGNCDGNASSFYRDMVEAWVAAGIFPVFAEGNAWSCFLPEPPGLSTVSSPASLGSAFAVGSTGNHDGLYATHSLWGPTTDASAGPPVYPDPRGYPNLKPQVVAPGVDIRSALDFDDNVYDLMSGTSMSAPHVTGLVALMLEAGECLAGDYATLGTLIMQTARPIDYDSGGDPAPGPGNIPNYATGWGEIDAPAAVDAAARACGPQGFLRGTVTAADGTPIAGAKVEVYVDEAVRVYELSTEADGSYIRRLPVNTTGYTVRVSGYGYLPSTETGIPIGEDATTRHDVALSVAPTYKINGRVTDAATGWPLHAKISISNYPGGALWTDPVTGVYAVRLPEGTHFRFDAASDIPGYATATREIASVTGGGVQDFALAADPVACSAPGYAYATSLASEAFENNGGAPPAGWTTSSAGLGWLFGTVDALSGSIFPIPEHGRFAAANDELGAGGGWDNDGRYDYLVMPALNFAATTSPVLRFKSFYVDAGGSARVEASTDGGATWSALGVPKSTDYVEGWTDEAISLAPVAGASALIRFHSDDGSTDEFGVLGGPWAIDDVAIVDACSAPASGGLVIGHVRDANTGASLDGASVSVDGGAPVTTATSADPGVGAGFYAAYAASATPSVEASRGTQPAGYGDATATPSVASGSTVLADLALPAGRLRLYPSGPAGTVELGTTASAPFTVTNSGTLGLQFGFEGAVVEEHFEEPDFPPSGWSVVNHGTGCVWSRNDPSRLGNYAAGDGLAAAINLWDDCRDLGAVDTSLITPPIDLSTSHTASMGFFLALFEGADSFPHLDVDISSDGGASWTTIFTETHDNNPFGPGALIELDLSAFAGSNDVRARFHYTAMPPYGHVEVDQVHLFAGISSDPLLDIDPEYGALAPGESRELNATFDARAVAQPGVYTVPVRVAEDTPYTWPFGDVEATMTVTPPASYGSIAGTVSSLGYCDANPVALPDATIRITANGGASYTTTSAADGSYRYWLAAADGPFTLTVEAADHVAATETFNLDPGAETTQDIGLRPLLPCLGTDPATLESTVPTGETSELAFDLLNLGAAGTDWTVRAGGDPAVLSAVPISQTVDPTPANDISFACINPGTGFVLENRYFRVFPLAERGTPDQDVIVGGISFAVESAQSGVGAQPITVRLYTLDGELTLENLSLVGEATTTVPDMELGRISVSFDQPITLPGNAIAVAELYVPESGDDGNAFYPGANSNGESAPAWWVAHDCGVNEPTSFPDIGFAWVNLILELDTLASDPCGAAAMPVDWLSLSPDAGTIAADSATTLQASFAAGAHAPGEYHGTMCVSPGQSSTPGIVPVRMTVGKNADAIFTNGFDG